MRLSLTILLTTLLVCTCKNNNNADPVKKQKNDTLSSVKVAHPAKDDFQTFAKAFLENVESYEDLFAYTRDNRFLMLYNPGVMPVIEIIEKGVRPDYRLKSHNFLTNFELTQDSLKPVFDCGSGWNKEGSFWHQGRNSDILKAYKRMIEFGGANPSDMMKEMTAAEMIANQDTYYIYATDTITGFYFVKFNGRFLLYMIDIVTPCDA